MRLPGFENVRPPQPTRHDEYVARRIAERLIREIDPDLHQGDEDGFYWSQAELSDRTWELQQAVMAHIPPGLLVRWCRKNFNPHNWEQDGIETNCRHYAPIAILEEVEKAVAHWQAKYEVQADSARTGR